MIRIILNLIFQSRTHSINMISIPGTVVDFCITIAAQSSRHNVRSPLLNLIPYHKETFSFNAIR